MTENQPSSPEPAPSDSARAQAAVFIAELHDEGRDADFEVRLSVWLAESEDHRRAYARLTCTWEQAGKMRLRARNHAPRLRARQGFALGAAAAGVILVVIAGIYFVREAPLITQVGEQKVRLLQDGTRVMLNTNTQIEVNYDEHARRVYLIRGEAHFDVSKNPNWPFLVSVDGEQIRALGTSFIVREEGSDEVSVTLVEGRISVTPAVASDESSQPSPQILSPGQRLSISGHQETLDRPDLNRVLAWEQGRVEFEDTPIADAVKEMNRYSKTRLTTDADTARLRIGGVFRAGDSDEFVRVVTAAFGLRVERHGHDVVLLRPL